MTHRTTSLITWSLAALALAVLPAVAAENHPRTLGSSIAGTMSGTVCRMGYRTDGADMIPPDFTFTGNPAASSITLMKNCTGPVIAEFDSEVVIAPSGGIHIEFYATCVATGGLAGACTPGQKFTGSPGTIYLADNAAGLRETHGMMLVIAGLKPGKWRFDIVPAADGVSKLGYRTLIVTAYKAG